MEQNSERQYVRQSRHPRSGLNYAAGAAVGVLILVNRHSTFASSKMASASVVPRVSWTQLIGTRHASAATSQCSWAAASIRFHSPEPASR
jgi:hypothetical protein